jgi:carbon monoxide dehydrogenase subunit G
MKHDNEFSINAPLHRAWAILLDLEQVAPCLPGASLQSAVPQAGTQADYHGTPMVKLGPITAKDAGTVSVAEADEGVRRVVLKADGKDARGHGLASATVISTLSEESGGTRLRVETDIRVTGRIAQFGQGLMQDVASKWRKTPCFLDLALPGMSAYRSCIMSL